MKRNEKFRWPLAVITELNCVRISKNSFLRKWNHWKFVMNNIRLRDEQQERYICKHVFA